MQCPNQWLPSPAARLPDNDDSENKFVESNFSRMGTEGTSFGTTREYYTEAELDTSITPFLARNKALDSRRRDYDIVENGKCVYKQGFYKEFPYGFEVPGDRQAPSTPGSRTQGWNDERLDRTDHTRTAVFGFFDNFLQRR